METCPTIYCSGRAPEGYPVLEPDPSRHHTMQEEQKYRRLLHEALARVPESEKSALGTPGAPRRMSCIATAHLVHRSIEASRTRASAKDYQFGMLSMKEHWSAGLSDMQETLQHGDWLDKRRGRALRYA